MSKRRSLGRNLEALLGDVRKLSDKPSAETLETGIEGELRQLPLTQIIPGKFQPRKAFPEHALKELADSIRAQGVIQPIVVRTVANNKFEIVAGERRWRAAQLAELERIPVLVRELPDEAAVAMALIENIQREDLNPIEEATALNRLIKEFDMTHEQIANAIGKSRSAVTNLLRLLSLAEAVKDLLEHGKLEMGHARSLLSLDDARQAEIAHKIVDKGLSVRETENMIRLINSPKNGAQERGVLSEGLKHLQQRLKQRFATRVKITAQGDAKGKIVISYRNHDELERLKSLLMPSE